MSRNESQLCFNCGMKIKRGVKFCPHCGNKQKKSIKTWLPIIFCVFFIVLLCILLIIGLKDNGFIVSLFQSKEKKDIAALEFYGGYVEDVEVFDYEDNVEKVILQEENKIANEAILLEDIGFTSDDVEPEVETIRELYYKTQEEQDRLTQEDVNGIVYYTYNEQIVKIEIKSGYDNSLYSRLYYYFDDQLYFAFVFNGTEEHRFYYKNEELIRYIDSSKIVYDYGTENFQNIIEMDDVILEEAKRLLTE